MTFHDRGAGIPVPRDGHAQPRGAQHGRPAAGSRRTTTFTGSFVWDVAGSDHVLATARMDLQVGMLAATRDLLAVTRTSQDFARRAYASAVLGSASALHNAAELWISETEEDPDAWLLWARVAAIRALRATDEGHPQAMDLVQIAVRACTRAAALWPEDPTPHVVLLSLDRLRYRAQVEAPGELGVRAPGPWDQFEQVAKLDLNHREAGHHLLAYFYPRHGGDAEALRTIAHWIAAACPQDSPLCLLPLYAELEHGPDTQPAQPDEQHEHRIAVLKAVLSEIDAGTYPGDRQEVEHRREQFAKTLAQETTPGYQEAERRRSLTYLAESLARQWFGKGHQPAYVPVRDLSVLAHALYAGGSLAWACTVLKHLSPHASTYPWSLFGPDPAEQLAQVCQECHLPLPRKRPG